MSKRADFQKNYLIRYSILAGVCLFLALWFAYDGLIGYPSKLPAARAYDELRELKTEERLAQWKTVSAENGWSSDTPKKTVEKIEGDITGQYFWAAINLLVGIPALVWFFRCRGSWVEPTDDGLTTSWGQTVRYAEVTQLNKKRWAQKGIAKASYKQDGVVDRVFVFDDFKYDRNAIEEMLRALEDVLGREQIVGGPTELESDATKARLQDESKDDDDSEDAGEDHSESS